MVKVQTLNLSTVKGNRFAVLYWAIWLTYPHQIPLQIIQQGADDYTTKTMVNRL